MLQSLPENLTPSLIVPPFLNASINMNALVVPQTTGFLNGRSQFLHFRNGEVLPFNDGLTGYVFPRYLFGKTLDEFSNRDLLVKSIKHGLATELNNRPFLLPSDISYPRHTVYMHIDYSNYPPPEELINVSYWNIWIQIKSKSDIKIVSAEQKALIYE